MTKLFAATLPSERRPDIGPQLQRTRGASAIAFKASPGGAVVDRLSQSGAAKIRLPRVEAGSPALAVLINTAGGVTGGDRLKTRLEAGPGTRAMVTTQACEKVYRSAGGDAELSVSISVSAGSRIDWLPQPSILFDGGCLSRRMKVDLDLDATLLLFEAVIFGRTARGEQVTSGLFRDRWRIRRAGKLLFADDLRFDWADAAFLHRPAVLGGNKAMATMLFVTPEPERRLDRLRSLIGDHGGVSAWNGKLLARVVAEGGAALQRVTNPVLIELLDGAVLPKLWLI